MLHAGSLKVERTDTSSFVKPRQEFQFGFETPIILLAVNEITRVPLRSELNKTSEISRQSNGVVGLTIRHPFEIFLNKEDQSQG